MIPIIIGVTGHRDIEKAHELKIRLSIRSRLKNLLDAYPSTKFLLLTGLAEGADQIFAEEALKWDRVQIAAILPMAQDDYESDFGTDAALIQFRNLLDKSIWKTVAQRNSTSCDRNDCYRAVGEFIAKNAQLVFALWDGIVHQLSSNGEKIILPGGTADVVNICRRGVRSPELLALPEPTHVEHLFVLREKNSLEFKESNIAKLAEWQRHERETEIEIEIERRITNVFQEIDRFNFESLKVPFDASVQSKSYLFEGLENKEVEYNLRYSIDVYAKADAMANKIQKQRVFAIRITSGLAAIAILWQQIYSGPDMRLGWLLAHIVTALAAYFVYMHYFRGPKRRDERFLDWRALAEGLRVQIFWAASGIEKFVSDFYFSEDTDELEWLRHAIRNVDLYNKFLESQGDIEWIQKVWLQGQQKYFERKAPLVNRLDKRFNRITHFLLISAGILTVSTFIFHAFGSDALELNFMVLASGLCFVMAAIIRSYSDQLAFSELKNRYKVMANIYKVAILRLDECLSAGDIEGCKQILVAIGREALNENVSWLRVHRQRQFEISVA